MAEKRVFSEATPSPLLAVFPMLPGSVDRVGHCSGAPEFPVCTMIESTSVRQFKRNPPRQVFGAAGPQRVVMNIQYLPQGRLVSAGKIPGYWNPEGMRRLKNALIAFK